MLYREEREIMCEVVKAMLLNCKIYLPKMDSH